MKQINTIVTSKEAILAVCLSITTESGLQALNIRTVAEQCKVSVGSIYNYFPSKADLIAATVAAIWQSIFHADGVCKQTDSFPAYVSMIFESIAAGASAYPQFFTAHSLRFAAAEKSKGRKVMEDYFHHMKGGLLAALECDKAILPSVFSDDFTKTDLIDFVFSNLLTLWMQQAKNCTILIKIICKVTDIPQIET